MSTKNEGKSTERQFLLLEPVMCTYAHVLRGSYNNFSKVKFADCSTDLTTAEGSIHHRISRREYDSTIKKGLTYPPEHAAKSSLIIIKETNLYLGRNCQVNLEQWI